MHIMMRLLVRFWVLVTAFTIFAPWASGQAPTPPPPDGYQVWVRYRINSARDQHVLQYDALIEHLKALKFNFQPPLEQHPDTDREDPNKNQLRGTVAAGEALKILRNPNVASMVLLPTDFKVPEAPEQPVRVQFELASGFTQERQRDLSEQTSLLLKLLGFREADVYEQRGYTGKLNTRLSGTIPAGRLETLLKDLRGQPAGWFGPRVTLEDLPAPLRLTNPIVVTEVLTDAEPLKDEPVAEPRSPDFLEKISADLWALVNDKAKESERVRVQLVLIGRRTAEESTLRQMLVAAAPSLRVEGHLGNTVVGTAFVNQVKALAALPEVAVIRLVRPARIDIDPALTSLGDPQKALTLSGLAELHAKGKRGQGVRLALIDNDFRGWDRLVKERKLNGKTRFVDLTAEHSRDILPSAAGPAEQLGHGAHCALATAAAAPDAELTLIRTDAFDPYQLEEIVRYLNGGDLSDNLRRRQDELTTERLVLDAERAKLLRERQIILEDFTDETDQIRDFAFLGPIRGWVFSRREWIRQRLAYQEKLEQALNVRKDRLYRLLDEVRGLKGIRLVANPLVWPDGMPAGGSGPLSRFLDAEAGRGLLWFQAAGNTRGQAWSGLYRDEDRNGVMEFSVDEQKLAKGQWTRELNFLGWQPLQGKRQLDLPAGVKIRLSLQWREPHDPDYFGQPGEEDHYRRPLADLRLVLVRQRDPQVKTLPADAFELIARSHDLPQRLEHLPSGTVYEQSLEATLDKGGRFAVRIERPRGSAWVLVDEPGQPPRFTQLHGLTPTGVRPTGAPTLTALERQWELKPRLFVQALDDQSGRRGRPVLVDFATEAGALAMPGDARNVVTVGAAGWDGSPQPFGAAGPPAFVELAKKPTVFAYDLVVAEKGPAYGTSLANAFAAGVAASLLSSGMSHDDVLRSLRARQGQVLRVESEK
jgi:hypothetical protein